MAYGDKLCLEVQITSMSLFINLVHNGDRKAKTNGAFMFPGDFMSSARQNCIVEAKGFMEPKLSLFHSY